MAYHHLVPPLQGTVKINVHGYFAPNTHINDNKSGIRVVFRNEKWDMKLITTGVVPSLSKLGNELWAMYNAVRRAHLHKYDNIILDTDNYEAYQVMKDFHSGAPASVFDIADQMDTLINDKDKTCVVSYVYPSRNRVARFLAKLGYETCDELYTLDRPVRGVEELLDWDMGMGIDHPSFLDIFISAEAPDPVNFDVVMTMGEQMNDLGLGQVDAPTNSRVELEEMERMEIIDGAQEGCFICRRGAAVALYYAWDPPMPDVECAPTIDNRRVMGIVRSQGVCRRGG